MSKIFLDKYNNRLVEVYGTDELVGNPTLTGEEPILTGIQIGNVKYRIASGVLPIIIPPVEGITFSDPNMTIIPGDYSDLEPYHPIISYIITFNNTDTIEFSSLTNDVLTYLHRGTNTVDITVKSIIQLIDHQQNIAYSTVYHGTIDYSLNYLDLLNDFNHEGVTSKIITTYNDENKTMILNKNRQTNTSAYMNLKFKESVSGYHKVYFTLDQCYGATQPTVELQTSTDNVTYTTFETITTPENSEQEYEFSIPNNISYFNFKLDLMYPNYDSTITIKNIAFE